jgi:xanthine dehydrogenase accessory factor
MPATILIRGGGDLASGVALRLHRIGLNVVITELERPLAVRRTVSFSEAVYEGQVTVEGVSARRVDDAADTLRILNILAKRQIPVLIDPECVAARSLHPLAIVDGRMTKRPPEPLSHNALLYLGLGPGFHAPINCHAVIETQRGYTLGRVIWDGSSLNDTSTPEGDPRRVLRAPANGILKSQMDIGSHVDLGQPIAAVGDELIAAPFAGIVRGMLRSGSTVKKGLKIGDLDARDNPAICQLVSDKSLAVGGGVLEALFTRPEARVRLYT